MRATSLRTLWPLYLLIAACSSDDHGRKLPYALGRVTVIGASDDELGEPAPDGTELPGTKPVLIASTSSSELCYGDKGLCDTPKEQCGDDASADVLVGLDDEVFSIVCYPDTGLEVEALADAAKDPELGDDVVAVLDGDDDGDDIKGDLLIESNDVIVYGSGPERSVIGGNLELAERGVTVRGVRIRGDVVLADDDSALVDCVIEGDLTVTGSAARLALCEVWGKVTIEGDGTALVSNLIAGDQAIRGTNLLCNDNFRFTDVAGDDEIQESDVLAPVNCLPPL